MQRLPTNARQFDKILQEWTKIKLENTIWGEEGIKLIDVIQKYFTELSPLEKSMWISTYKATLCRSRVYDHISVKTLEDRKPLDPQRPWLVSSKTLQHDRKIMLGGGYSDGPWPLHICHPLWGWTLNRRSMLHVMCCLHTMCCLHAFCCLHTICCLHAMCCVGM